MEVTAERGLLLKSISPASLNLPFKNKVKTCGMEVEMGQPFEQPGTLHFIHRSASDLMVIYYFHYLLLAGPDTQDTDIDVQLHLPGW